MFCNQCEQTARGEGCLTVGVCGKDPQTSALQDLLTYTLRGMAHTAQAAKAEGIGTQEADRVVLEALFSTLTNVNFDAQRITEYIRRTESLRDQLLESLDHPAAIKETDPAVTFEPASSPEQLEKQGRQVRLPIDWERDEDVRSLQETTLYGLRGLAAYAYHAALLGQTDGTVVDFAYRVLTSLPDKSLDTDDWVALALETGKVNLRAMELLDAGNTGMYGHPTPTEVPLGHRGGKAILVSGHDLADLEQILRQTEGTGINVYTHGEMLPTHGYPELKKYSHFYGHYGTAWQNQTTEFAQFPGAILMTTNCIQEPEDSYAHNIFTTGVVGWPGVTHLPGPDFTPVIEKALELEGFTEDADQGTVWVGFGHEAVLGESPLGSIAGTIIDHVKQGKIRHFYLVGGCDGAKAGRNYYTEFVEKAPQDTVILTLACGKFRFFDKDLGAVDGIPRLVDVGQCNDAYSAVQIALALAEAFDTEVNDLPLSIICSWYEQKAVSILLSLLHLGIKDIRLGPTLPAFVSENVLGILVENFNIKPISTAEADLAATLEDDLAVTSR